MFVGGNQKARRAASRVENGFVFLRVNHVHDEFDDIARGAELAVVGLHAHALLP